VTQKQKTFNFSTSKTLDFPYNNAENSLTLSEKYATIETGKYWFKQLMI